MANQEAKDNDRSAQAYDKQFLKSILIVCLIAVVASVAWVVAVGLLNPLATATWYGWDVRGQSILALVTMVPGLAVSLAGAWVAIRIAEAAKAAQDTSNKLQHPDYILTMEYIFLRFELISQIQALRLSCVNFLKYKENLIEKYEESFCKNQGDEDQDGNVSFEGPSGQKYQCGRGNKSFFNKAAKIEAEIVMNIYISTRINSFHTPVSDKLHKLSPIIFNYYSNQAHVKQWRDKHSLQYPNSNTKDVNVDPSVLYNGSVDEILLGMSFISSIKEQRLQGLALTVHGADLIESLLSMRDLGEPLFIQTLLEKSNGLVFSEELNNQVVGLRNTILKAAGTPRF